MSPSSTPLSQTFQNCPSQPKFFTDQPKFFTYQPKCFPRPTKMYFFNNISEFSQFFPIQLRFANNIRPFLTKVAPLPLWFLQPWLSTTNDFYRNYQELEVAKWGAENNLPLPPVAATDDYVLMLPWSQ